MTTPRGPNAGFAKIERELRRRRLTARKIAERDDALREIAKYLDPQNENVRRGDLVAAIRDLAQIALAEKDNAEKLERLVLVDGAEVVVVHFFDLCDDPVQAVFADIATAKQSVEVSARLYGVADGDGEWRRDDEGEFFTDTVNEWRLLKRPFCRTEGRL